MKKLVLTTVCALAMTGAAFAQGDVSWASFTPLVLNAHTNAVAISPLFGGGSGGGTVGSTATAAGGFYYELLYGGVWTTSGQGLGNIQGANSPSNSYANLFGGSWLDTGLSGTNGIAANGVVAPINPTTQASVPWAAGQTDNIVLVGWSANIGALGTGQNTWLNVSNVLANWATMGSGVVGNAFFGATATGYIAGNSSSPGNTVFSTSTTASYGLPINGTGFQMYLLPVPEPGTLALAGLGGLSLLLFRRQRK